MMTFVFVYVYALSLAIVLSIVMVKVCMMIANRFGVVAHPRENRLHSEAVPLLGGVAIVAAFYLTIIINYLILTCVPGIEEMVPKNIVPFIHGAIKTMPQVSIVLIGGLMIAVLGLFDDIKHLGAKRKFLVEICLGILLYVCDIRITIFMGVGIWSLLITIFWVVAVTNAFNLLDNIDGLSSGVAVISSFILFLLCVQGGQIMVSLLLLIFIGSLLGFLRYNYTPAKIFMGDCGSLFIGYIMSVLTIMSTFYSNGSVSIIPFAAPMLILAVPFYDTSSVIYIRIKNRKSIFVGDKNHFSHRLLRIGMTVKQAVLFIYLVSLCLGIAALALVASDIKNQIILLCQSGGILTIIYLFEKIKTKE